MDYFKADIARSQMFTSNSSRGKMCTWSISNMVYHKFSHGATSYMFNGKNINVILEFILSTVVTFDEIVLTQEAHFINFTKYL